MTIYHANGATEDGVVIREEENSIRAAIRGSSDVIEFTRVHADLWVTSDCDLVRIQLGAPVAAPVEGCQEEDFICPPALARRLLRVVRGEQPEAVLPALDPSFVSPYDGLQ